MFIVPKIMRSITVNIINTNNYLSAAHKNMFCHEGGNSLEYKLLASKSKSALRICASLFSASQKWERAAELWSVIVEVSPNDELAWYMLGSAKGRLGCDECMIRCWRNIPGLVDSFIQLSQRLIYSNQISEAIYYAELATQLASDNILAWSQLAQSLEKKCKSEQEYDNKNKHVCSDAIDSYQQAIALDPNNWEYYSSAGKIALYYLHDCEQGYYLLLDAVALNPNAEGSVRYSLANASFCMSQWSSAIENYYITAEEFAMPWQGYANLGRALQEAGNTEESISILEDAVQEFPLETSLWFWLGKGYEKMGRTCDAVIAFKNAATFGDSAIQEIELSIGKDKILLCLSEK